MRIVSSLGDRFVRNPMCVGVGLVLVGESMVFGSALLVVYTALLLLGFHLAVERETLPILPTAGCLTMALAVLLLGGTSNSLFSNSLSALTLHVTFEEHLFLSGVLSKERGDANAQFLQVGNHRWLAVLFVTNPRQLLPQPLAELAHLLVLRLKLVDQG